MRGLPNMRPAREVYDAADVAPTQIERVRDRLVSLPGHRSSTNRSHDVVGQFGIVVLLAFLPAMSGHVAHIPGPGVPPQISQVVVAGVPVRMARLMPGWTGTDEGFQDKAVNVSLFTPTKNDDQAIVMTAWRPTAPRFQTSPLRTETPAGLSSRPHGPIRANAITERIFDVSIGDGHSSVLSQIGGMS